MPLPQQVNHGRGVDAHRVRQAEHQSRDLGHADDLSAFNRRASDHADPHAVPHGDIALTDGVAVGVKRAAADPQEQVAHFLAGQGYTDWNIPPRTGDGCNPPRVQAELLGDVGGGKPPDRVRQLTRQDLRNRGREDLASDLRPNDLHLLTPPYDLLQHYMSTKKRLEPNAALCIF
ncbi:MAG TPA: hypothetical protein DDW30_03080 [Clostridiales bacterium]|nr:hypothetical protein [Clostridiales bacterium]